MSDSPILSIPHVAPTQTDKTTTMNAAIDQLEAALQDQLAVSMAAGNVTLSTMQYTRYQVFVVSGLTATRTLIVPATKRIFVVRNTSSFSVVVQGGTGSTITLAAGNGAVLQNDGAQNIFTYGAGGPGAPGSVWREGSGAPSNSLGVDGDFYLNGTNGDVYIRTSGAYATSTNIMGPTGTIAAIAPNDLIGNIGTGSAAPTGLTLTQFLDAAAGNVRGDILYRSNVGWVVLAPGTAGNVLQTQGTTANPTWASPVSGVSTVVAGSGLAGGTITTSGTVSLAAIAAGDLLGNPGTASAVPSAIAIGGGLSLSVAGTLSATSVATMTQVVAGAGLAGGTITTAGTISLGTIAAGDLLGNAGTVAAVPGAIAIGAGLSLSAVGTLSATGSGGTVTQVVAGTGLAGGTITGTGTISLGAIATLTFLYNGGTATAVPTAMSLGAAFGLEYAGFDPQTVWGFDGVGWTPVALDYSYFPQSAAHTLLGNPTASTAAVGDIAIGTGLAFSTGTLSATGSGGTVTQIIAGSGLAGGTVTATGTFSLATIAAGNLMGNAGTLAAVPGAIVVGNGLELLSTGTLTADVQNTQTVSGATATISPTGAQSMAITLQANTTLTVSAGYDGQHLRLKLIQDGTGSRTVAFDTSVKFGTDLTSFTASTAASAIDLVQLIYDLSHTRWMFAAVNHGF